MQSERPYASTTNSLSRHTPKAVQKSKLNSKLVFLEGAGKFLGTETEGSTVGDGLDGKDGLEVSAEWGVVLSAWCIYSLCKTFVSLKTDVACPGLVGAGLQ